MKKIEFFVFTGDESPLQKQTCICRENALESNLAIVQKIAYNGKYTIDEVDEPEAPPTDAERIAELEKALAMLLNGVTE